MKRPLARWLRAYMDEEGRYWGGSAEWEGAMRDLRALLAVARAADRHTNPHERCPACDPRISKALARLSRLSQPRGERKEKR